MFILPKVRDLSLTAGPTNTRNDTFVEIHKSAVGNVVENGHKYRYETVGTLKILIQKKGLIHGKGKANGGRGE
jgi:hypothetical protein